MENTRIQTASPEGAAGGVAPEFPLLLLETMRDMDRPTEVLEDEDVTLSMPRRFGLSDVVGLQIKRLRDAVRQKRPQPVGQVEELVRLVIRRPDAEEIFREAGRRMARRAWEERTGAMRTLISIMPRPLALVAAHRAAGRLFRRLVGGAGLLVERRPLRMTVRGSLTARADPGGAACAFYAGTLAELLEIYTGRAYRISHPRCEASGAGDCSWKVEIAS